MIWMSRWTCVWINNFDCIFMMTSLGFFFRIKKPYEDTMKAKLLEPSTPDDDSKHSQSNKLNKNVYIIFISLLLDLLAFTIILPLFPTILERYRKDDTSGLYALLSSQIRYFQNIVGAPDKYTSVLFGGFLGSMFSFLQFVVSPIMGALSDCYGRKPMLLISLVSLEMISNQIHSTWRLH